ncbi:MAG: N-acetyl-gamma-glutamyl-phosphate reductase [Lachnospiraceae bacterium]|nr:N-acetyl-gamma-glutamyl-phosphate reductase [Lachnospiraceae bacterium]
MIKAGVIGATGYGGSELMRLLSAHPEVEINVATSQSYTGMLFSDVYENFRNIEDIKLNELNIEEIAFECDVVFMALPHGVAAKTVNEDILKKTKIIDFGADFRLKNYEVYEKWYGIKHEGQKLLEDAVYGLCELNREQIKGASLVANPGCYTTCSILAMAPLIVSGIIDPDSIIIDAKSGVSGSGRGLSLGSMFCECNENMKAYKIASHRHTPEIEEQLSYLGGKEIVLSFTPHLIPMNRGILATCYSKLSKEASYEDIYKIYSDFYKDEYFVRLTKKGVFPETKWVKGSNFIDIGLAVDERTNRVIVVSAIDNLVKGAAGQAVQNMNIMFGFDEKTGLSYVPPFPI